MQNKINIFQRATVLLSIRNEMQDHDSILRSVEEGISFRGMKLWLLMFAAVIVSVGLNVNSPTVIIGGMLLSPLAGPVNGMGYSVATYDFKLFRRSLKNFGFAVAFSLFASVLYFLITPVSRAQSELLAQIHPTIYDVVIALFGGSAGVLAIASKVKGNILIGVSIATTLMPALCTAGYGIATGQMNFFFAALYLFLINSLFIGLAGLVVGRFLKFPLNERVSEGHKSTVKGILSVLIIVTAAPSIYFGYQLVQNERFSEHAANFSKLVSSSEGSYLLKKEVESEQRKITLTYGGLTLTEAEKNRIWRTASTFDLGKNQVIIKQGFAFEQSEINQEEVLRRQLSEMNSSLTKIKNQRDSVVNIPKTGFQLVKEIKPLFPEIRSCAFSQTSFYSDSLTNEGKHPLVVFTSRRNSLSNTDKSKIRLWLSERLNDKKVVTLFEE